MTTPDWFKEKLKGRIYEYLQQRKVVSAKERISKQELNKRIQARQDRINLVLKHNKKMFSITPRTAKREHAFMNRLGLGKQKGIYKEYPADYRPARHSWKRPEARQEVEFIKRHQHLGPKQTRTLMESRFRQYYSYPSVQKARLRVIRGEL